VLYRKVQILYVKRLTQKEAELALRDLIIDDVDFQHLEGANKECPDDAALNLSDSDEEPSAEM
jgi:hypothetical protein